MSKILRIALEKEVFNQEKNTEPFLDFLTVLENYKELKVAEENFKKNYQNLTKSDNVSLESYSLPVSLESENTGGLIALFIILAGLLGRIIYHFIKSPSSQSGGRSNYIYSSSSNGSSNLFTFKHTQETIDSLNISLLNIKLQSSLIDFRSKLTEDEKMVMGFTKEKSNLIAKTTEDIIRLKPIDVVTKALSFVEEYTEKYLSRSYTDEEIKKLGEEVSTLKNPELVSTIESLIKTLSSFKEDLQDKRSNLDRILSSFTDERSLSVIFSDISALINKIPLDAFSIVGSNFINNMEKWRSDISKVTKKIQDKHVGINKNKFENQMTFLMSDITHLIGLMADVFNSVNKYMVATITVQRKWHKEIIKTCKEEINNSAKYKDDKNYEKTVNETLANSEKILELLNKTGV